MSSYQNGVAHRVHRQKRLKIAIACDPCRIKKIKCNGAQPSCDKCNRKLDQRDKCRYSFNPANKSARIRHSGLFDNENISQQPPSIHQQPPLYNNDGIIKPSPPHISPRSNTTPQESPPRPRHRPILAKPNADEDATSTVDSMNAAIDGASLEYFGSSSAGSFTRQIKAAIDARLGHPQPAHPVSRKRLQCRRHSTALLAHDSADQVLPPRRLADELMATYWCYIHTLYPFLDKNQWDKYYISIFAGCPIETDERIFSATLNMIFALSTQLMENLEPGNREHSSNVYFERAQELLDLTAWDPGCIELIQYLLLASQYLQCTNSPHQTWMVAGAATRIAQSLGLHLPETSSAESSPRQREIYRRVWHGCVLMDRMISLTHGRPAMVSAELATSVPRPLFSKSSSASDELDDLTDASFFVKSIELYEITHNLTTKLYPGSGQRTKQFQTSSLEDLLTVVQIDDELTNWEKGLPKNLIVPSSKTEPTFSPTREAVILQLRLCHTRILLLRPILSMICLPHDTKDAADISALSLRQKIYEQCSIVCVNTARSTISCFLEYQVFDGTVGLLPAWWYRLYYLFSASTVLIAARLRPDMFAEAEISQSWEESMRVFQNLQNVSPSARKCVAALQILSSKIVQTVLGENRSAIKPIQFPNTSLPPDQAAIQQASMAAFDQMFDFSNVNISNFTLDIDDLSWLNEMTTWNVLNE